MDQAFLRRLPYKIEVGAPDRPTYRSIFDKLCAQFGIEMTDEIFEFIIRKITKEKAMDLAAYHARFIIDQVVAIARFMNEAPKLTESNIGYALDNLKVNSPNLGAT
jgi:chromosomal replication initiation ATPase DnaA